MKTFTNKSNAARAGKKANGGSLTGLELKGEEGAWYYAPKAGQPEHVPTVAKTAPAVVPTVLPSAAPAAKQLAKVKTATKKLLALDTSSPEHRKAKKAAPAKPAPKAKKAAPAKKAAKKAVPAKKAPVAEYNVKTGPTQGRISGYHIDTDRDEKHGVSRRSAGTIGGRLWAIFDKLAAKAGKPKDLEIAVVKASPLVADFNANKVVIEFYYWRRYNGVRGRGKKQKVDA